MLFKRLKSLATRLITSQIGRDTLSSMGLKISSVGLVFLSTVLLARSLGPADYGIYAYVYALISLLSVPSQFGLPTLVVRETARGMAEKDYSLVQGIWRWSGWMAGLISLALVILTGISLFFFKESLTDIRLGTFLWGLLLVPLIALGNLRGAALRGLHQVVIGQLPEFIIRPGLFVFLLAGSIWLGAERLSAPLAMVFYATASALAFGAGIWLLWQRTPSEISQAIPHYQSRNWFMSALPLAFIGGMQLVNQQASILLQGFYLSDAEIGIFRVATQVSNLASFGLIAINMVVAPRFAALYVQSNIGKLQHLVTRSSQVILTINLAITAGFIMLGKPFLRLLFSEIYVTAYLPLLILLGGQLVNSGVGSVGVLLNMANLERESAKALALSALLNILLNVLLLPSWGIIGSSIATALSLIVWNIILWWIVRKKLSINSFAVKI